jgi:hypothetical protein
MLFSWVDESISSSFRALKQSIISLNQAVVLIPIDCTRHLAITGLLPKTQSENSSSLFCAGKNACPARNQAILPQRLACAMLPR